MDNRSEIRAFLASRRAKITPEQAGLPVYGANRRVTGLRREEVAMLAGVSVDYYIRLERGNLSGASESVLDSLAGALQLDEAERAHLFDLARTAGAPTSRPRRRTTRQQVRPSIQRLLDAMTGAPAFVRNARLDVLSANPLGRALYLPMHTEDETGPGTGSLVGGVRAPNMARFLFLDPASTDFWRDWDGAAQDTVALLRTEAGRDPYDKALTDLVGELSTRSEHFRTLWADHNVRLHRTGIKKIHHPIVGDLDLTYEVLELPADTGLTMLTYSAEPDTASQDGLQLLASWAATVHPVERTPAPD